jgi:hypothetical protein
MIKSEAKPALAAVNEIFSKSPDGGHAFSASAISAINKRLDEASKSSPRGSVSLSRSSRRWERPLFAPSGR